MKCLPHRWNTGQRREDKRNSCPWSPQCCPAISRHLLWCRLVHKILLHWEPKSSLLRWTLLGWTAAQLLCWTREFDHIRSPLRLGFHDALSFPGELPNLLVRMDYYGQEEDSHLGCSTPQLLPSVRRLQDHLAHLERSQERPPEETTPRTQFSSNRKHLRSSAIYAGYDLSAKNEIIGGRGSQNHLWQ